MVVCVYCLYLNKTLSIKGIGLSLKDNLSLIVIMAESTEQASFCSGIEIIVRFLVARLRFGDVMKPGIITFSKLKLYQRGCTCAPLYVYCVESMARVHCDGSSDHFHEQRKQYTDIAWQLRGEEIPQG